jgi:hypothetical protein
MQRRRSGWIWGGRVAALVVVAGLVAYLSSVGLDKADKLASVLSLLVALVALVAPYLLPSSDGNRSEPGSAQHVTDAAVGGHLTQVRKARGVRVQGPVTSGAPQTTQPGAGPGPSRHGGQYVNGVWVGGNLTQVDGADGDITIG